MTIKKALQKKNNLIKEISECYEIARTSNSFPEGTAKRFDVETYLKKASALTSELVELKTKIHEANLPVYSDIFLLSELKGRVKRLRGISTDEGPTPELYGSHTVKEVQIDAAQLRNMVKNLENEIETLQDKLEYHNVTTVIE